MNGFVITVTASGLGKTVPTLGLLRALEGAGTPAADASMPTPQPIPPGVPPAFGLVQVWSGTGKGKTTAALGIGIRAASDGCRVTLLQFMKGGADGIDVVRGEYNGIRALPGLSFETVGCYGWLGLPDTSDENAYVAEGAPGLERARKLVATTPRVAGSPPLAGPSGVALT